MLQQTSSTAVLGRNGPALDLDPPAGLTSFSTNLPGKKYIVRGRHHYILHTCLCVYLGHNTDPTSSNLHWSL